MIKQYYRIFDEKHDVPHTLFHGVNGSRKLPLNEWITAKIKPVREARGKIYKSGFHVLKTKAEAVEFLATRFKNTDHRVISPIFVDESAGIWKKHHSRANVFLVKKILISKKQWKKREHLQD